MPQPIQRTQTQEIPRTVEDNALPRYEPPKSEQRPASNLSIAEGQQNADQAADVALNLLRPQDGGPPPVAANPNQPPANFSADADNIDWNQATQVKRFGSTNPVFELKNGAGNKLYVKFTEGNTDGIRFGNQVVKAAGLTAPATKFVSLSPGAGHPVLDKLKSLGADVGKASQCSSLMIMDEVPGQTAGEYFENKTPQETAAVFNDDKFQKQFGRLIAADMVTGNFDRVGFRQYSETVDGKQVPKYHTKLHVGNFHVEQDGQSWNLHTLDNETFNPHTDLLKPGNQSPEGRAELFAKGGKADDEKVPEHVPDSTQFSMDKMLSDATPESVKQLMDKHFGAKLKGIDMGPAYANIAQEVKNGVRDIVGQLKGDGGLNEAAKEASAFSPQAADYDAFKIKTRYADMLTRDTSYVGLSGKVTKPISPDAALDRVKGYSEYRAWKGDLKETYYYPSATPGKPDVQQLTKDIGENTAALKHWQSGLEKKVGNPEYKKALQVQPPGSAHTNYIRQAEDHVNRYRTDVAAASKHATPTDRKELQEGMAEMQKTLTAVKFLSRG
jgi:hypothetical protein